MVRRFSDADIYWSRSETPGGRGVLVVAGSSGRLDADRADALAAAGATALALRWFGGASQPATPCEVPLETFIEAIDLLAVECERIAVLGLSYGAEAALLTAVRDWRINAAVALAPTDVVWEGHRQHDDDPPRSKWTWCGEPVPFVPLVWSWVPESPRPAFAPHYAHSRAMVDPATVETATIPVELFLGNLVLVAGGDDQVGPSGPAARAISARRAAHGLETTIIEDQLRDIPCCSRARLLLISRERTQWAETQALPSVLGNSPGPRFDSPRAAVTPVRRTRTSNPTDQNSFRHSEPAHSARAASPGMTLDGPGALPSDLAAADGGRLRQQT